MASVATTIRRKVESGPEDRVWTFRDFVAYPANTVGKTLSRLASTGLVHRVCKRVYYRPRTTRFGETKPDTNRVLARMLDDRRVEWKPGGPGVWNALGLTT